MLICYNKFTSYFNKSKNPRVHLFSIAYEKVHDDMIFGKVTTFVHNQQIKKSIAISIKLDV